MSQAVKIRYEVDLSLHSDAQIPTVAGHLRRLTENDRLALAHLMIDAYRGTIDSEDETLDDAIAEVASWFEDDPLLRHSFGVEHEGRLVSAVLVSLAEQAPFVGYVMTAGGSKSKGLGSAVVEAAFASLRNDGYVSAVFYITKGNRPSERLFTSLGAVAVPESSTSTLEAAARREAGSAYLMRFRPGEPVDVGVIRILTALNDEMIGFLDDPHAFGIEVAIHEVRRRGKQARSLLRLVRPAIGDDYGNVNRCYRDAGRALAQARDARIVLETFDGLVEDGSVHGDVTVRLTLADRAEAAEAAMFGLDGGVAGTARNLLDQAGRLVSRFTFADADSAVLEGATTTYRAGRRAFKQVGIDPTPSAFHTWRKRVKDHRHQLAFLWECHPVSPDTHDLLYELSDALGAAHDLVVVSEHLDQTASDTWHGIARRQEKYELEAMELGGAIYRTTPAEFRSHLQQQWSRWRSSA